MPALYGKSDATIRGTRRPRRPPPPIDSELVRLACLLRHPGAVEPRSLVPRDIPVRFDPGAMPDIDRRVRRSGTRLLFVNGTQDPSIAEPFPPGRHDSRVLRAPGTDHHTIIAAFPTADRTEATTPDDTDLLPQYATTLAARGRALPWPPQRSAACWCGSGRAYGECHGMTG
ncbi:SEC-C domain-containing protein [Streptomyces incanus]|uniref:SEC-C metal-binding domain-containing protein n=1 Tax=Streptomyces incanus TaxID=887453 RepID=A0ABW0Y0D3_9ACTN